MDAELKMKLFDMTSEEREEFINNILDRDIGGETMRFLLIEQLNLKQRSKEIVEKLAPLKTDIIEALEATKIKSFEISDGVVIGFRKGSSRISLSYKDVEKHFPHLIDEIQKIVKYSSTANGYSTRYTKE